MKINFNINIDFFKENKKGISEVLYTDPILKKTLDDIINFMQYMGIERITLSGKTKKDNKNYRRNLRTRRVEI